MLLDVTDEETAALAGLLTNRIGDDRCPLSLRVQTLKAILGKLRPEPAREALPEPKYNEPPRLNRGRRRRG
jgi:hypothetical protein